MNSSYKGDTFSPESCPCPYCGQSTGIVWVHGHGQCAACGTNVDECCRGEYQSVLSTNCLEDTKRNNRT